MPQDEEVIYYDVAIIGAGPAGCSCALALKDAGLKVALLDKQSFPRDKVCGDAIPGRVIKILGNMDPLFATAFRHFPQKLSTRETILHYKEKEITFNWVVEAYTCTRMKFDHFLFSLVKEHTATDILTGSQAETIIIHDNEVSITIKNTRKIIKAKIIIGADGANSVVAKQLTNKTLDRKHHISAVRAYYGHVGKCDEDATEIYFDKKFLPSYLWVFPLPGDTANVGFGMVSSEIARQKINIKKAFYEFIKQDVLLKSKFKDAIPISELQGFGLPLGSKIGTLSGNRFMMIGDAASLIDPISGDGIGNAMLSGKLAAEQVTRCFKNNDFTAKFIKQYDENIFRAIGKELRYHHLLQQILFKIPLLLDLLFFIGKSRWFKKIIQKGL